MTVTAKEYAQFEKTDPATFLQMRVALTQAMVDLDAEKAAGTTITADIVKQKIRQAVLREPILKAAGTQELVARYYDHGDGEALLKFYHAVAGKVDADGVEKFREGETSVLKLVRIGSAYNQALKELGGADSLAQMFQTAIRANPAITDGLSIKPSPFTAGQIKTLDKKEKAFRFFDKFTRPYVGHLLAHNNSQLEQRFTRVGAELTRLQAGSSKDVAQDAQAVAAQFFKTGAFSVPQTAEQGKAFAKKTYDLIVKARSGDAGILKAPELNAEIQKASRVNAL